MSMEITLATYNAMNLFDSLHPGGAKPKREMQSLAYVVNGLRADIIALQEVGSDAALNELNERLEDPFPHLGLVAGNSARGISLAFMSRFAFAMTSHARRMLVGEHGETLQDYRDEEDHRAQRLSPLTFQRDLLLGEFTLTPTVHLAVFNAHLKSRSRSPWTMNSTEAIRLAEASEAARIVAAYRKRHPHLPVVVAGDLNERREHPSVSPLVTLPGLSDPVRDELTPANGLVTTYWSKQRERIDYLLLCEQARHAYVPGSVAITASAAARKASDHLPVTLTLRMPSSVSGGIP
jgi:endonuclease/exonuclease/phosphatase family metal-dependent hydrolase